MTSPTNKRPRYFDGQYLQDVDFVSEQNYHLDRQRRLPSLLTVSGIAGGLKWLNPEIQPGQTSTENLIITIAPGTAIDAAGRQIVLLAERQIDLPENLTGEQILYIAYHQQDSEDANDKQGESSTRTSEEPLLGFVTPDDHDSATQIALAKLDLKNGKVQQLDLSVRQYSGIYLPSSEPEKSGPSLRSGGDTQPRLAVLDGDFSIQGTLAVSGSSTISGNSTLMGNVGIGQEPGTAKLTVAGDTAIAGALTLQETLAVNGNSTMTGNVGIGQEPGTAKLTVGGDTAIMGMARVVDSDRAVLELTKAVSGAHGRHAYLVSRDNAANVFATDLGFRVRNSLQSWQVDDIADALTIFHNGNVGIGTETPDAKLEVAGSLAVTDTSRLSGNVGIGTAPTSNRLTVQGNTSLSGNLTVEGKYVVQNAVNGTNARGIFLWKADDSNWGIYMGEAGANRSLSGGSATAGAGFSSHAMRLRTHSVNNQGLIYENSKEELNLSVRASDGLTYFRGNVGIGTQNPSQKLQVDGNIAATRIAARDITGTSITGTDIISGKNLRGKIRHYGPYIWNQGNPATRMTSASQTVCFLTYVRGKFNGHEEWVAIRARGGHWYLEGNSDQDHVRAEAICIG